MLSTRWVAGGIGLALMALLTACDGVAQYSVNLTPISPAEAQATLAAARVQVEQGLAMAAEKTQAAESTRLMATQWAQSTQAEGTRWAESTRALATQQAAETATAQANSAATATVAAAQKAEATGTALAESRATETQAAVIFEMEIDQQATQAAAARAVKREDFLNTLWMAAAGVGVLGPILVLLLLLYLYGRARIRRVQVIETRSGTLFLGYHSMGDNMIVGNAPALAPASEAGQAPEAGGTVVINHGEDAHLMSRLEPEGLAERRALALRLLEAAMKVSGESGTRIPRWDALEDFGSADTWTRAVNALREDLDVGRKGTFVKRGTLVELAERVRGRQAHINV